MYSRIALGIVFIFVIAVGANASPASALTKTEIQSQIQQLVLKVEELTKQIKALQEQVPDDGITPIVPGEPPRVCDIPQTSFSVGSQGDNVLRLQEFLHNEGYLSVTPTGYFGPVTKTAVASWQAAEGLPSAGIFGPLSHSKIRIWCSGGSSGLKASPQSGSAPLYVTFYTNITGFRQAGQIYTIDFGDGTKESATNCYAPTDYCITPGQNTHTYSTNGTYTATLNKTFDPCGGNPICKAPISTEVVGKVQIYVGTTSACTKEYNPVCGRPHGCKSCTEMGYTGVACPAICQLNTPATYSNRCNLDVAGAVYLHSGVCTPTSGN